MSQSSSGHKARFLPADRGAVLQFWESRFGIPEEAFEGYDFYVKGKNIWGVSISGLPALRYEALGLRMISIKETPWKPSTSALQVFGRRATKNAIDIDDDSARIFMAGGTVHIEAMPGDTLPGDVPSGDAISDDVSPGSVLPGYVLVTHGDDILGCGLYSKGRLTSMLPKERRMKIEEDER